jgi:hypothetical protein
VEASLTVLYTGSLRGDLTLLPRLFSFIRQLRAHYSEEAVVLCPDDPAPANPRGRVLLLDLGDSCTPDVWHCQVTGGRSTLVALDSMGYDAANVTGFLAPDGRSKLGDMVRMALVDDEHPAQIGDVTVQCRSGSATRPYEAANVTILIDSADNTSFEDNRLSLAHVNAGQVGVGRLCTKKTPYELEEHTIFDLPRQTQPDPTIAGVVDFVISEAKYTQKRRQS